MKQVPVYKKLLSYLYPVLIRKSSGTKNTVLELFLHRGEYQLGTYDALYSDGTRYRPLLRAFRLLEKELPGMKRVLVLGTGLASAVHMLEERGIQPSYVLVEADATVLKWAQEFLPPAAIPRTETVCDDAKHFMELMYGAQFDLVIIDIFLGRVVPDFVTTTTFLKNCRQGMNPGGYMMLNYIVHSMQDWQQAKKVIDEVFPGSQEVELGINRLIIAQV